jgi:hypothetical protein
MPLSQSEVNDLLDLVEAAELTAELEARREDLLAGIVPAGMPRALFPAELAARTNFAAMDAAGAQLQADLTNVLSRQRARILEQLHADIAAQPDVTTAYRRLVGLRTLGLTNVAGVADTIEATRAEAEELLFTHALDAAERLRQEAIAQGREVGQFAELDIDTIIRLDDTATRLAQGPPADLLRTVTDDVAARRLEFTTPAQLADHVRSLGGTLSVGPLEAHAGEAVGVTEGTARQGAAKKVGTAAAIYASELLDRNTCGPCSMVDGHRYVDEAAALVDYPAGIFRQCAGGLRCRGTLVYVWDTEAVPTVDEQPPAGPATLPPEGPPPAPPGPPPDTTPPAPSPPAPPPAPAIEPEPPAPARPAEPTLPPTPPPPTPPPAVERVQVGSHVEPVGEKPSRYVAQQMHKGTKAGRRRGSLEPGAPVPASNKGAQAVQHTKDVIDRLHGSPELTANPAGLPLLQTSGERTLGKYSYFTDGRPHHIEVSSKGAEPGLSYAHEFGHYFDHRDIDGNPGYTTLRSTAADDPLKPWRDAVHNSRAYQRLRELRRTSSIDAEVDGVAIRQRVDFNYVGYLLNEQELWARSYAQWVATESADPALVAELEGIVDGSKVYPRQWAADDFEPIRDAIRQVLEEGGHLRVVPEFAEVPVEAAPAAAGELTFAPTADELKAAKRDLPNLKAQYRAHAAKVQDDALGFFEHTDTRRLQRPPAVAQKRTAGGRIESTGRREGAANWDWFDGLSNKEQVRLRRTWASLDDGTGISPDEMVAQIADRYGLDPIGDEQQIIDLWLEQTRRYDAGGALARGKLPVEEAYGNVDVNALVDSPYNLRILFGGDSDVAAAHIAATNARIAEEEAARLFPSVRPGFDPPWAMAEDDYAREVLDLEERARHIVPLTDDAQWGTTYSPGDEAVLDRLGELIPSWLEDPAQPLNVRDLHRKMMTMARRARLVP